MPDLNILKSAYLLRGHNANFAIGRRSNLRYALKSGSVSVTKINLDGPEPLEYLDYAKADLSCNTPQGPINALGNAKQAIHLVMDTFFTIWSLDKIYSKSSFPNKLKLMQELDAFPVRMIDALNRTRNIIEHDFKTIKHEDSANFVDITEMFLIIAYSYFKNPIVSAYVGVNGDQRCLEWQLDRDNYEIRVFSVNCTSFIDTELGRIYYNIEQNDKRSLLSTVEIRRNNFEEWLPYLDLFIYYTKYLTLILPDEGNRGPGIHLNTHTFGF
jgi:hypothetical protein